MNRDREENEFQVGLGKLLEAIRRELAPEAPDPYLGSGKQVVHEHDTRLFFFDRFLSLLGWQLGLGGNIAEEARVKAETTTFMDYAAVNSETRAPALVVEAKSWEKPFVSPRGGKRPDATERELIVEAVRHIRGGGSKATTPVTGDWHDYLVQLSGYVRDLKDRYGHELPRAMLSSGQWLLVFTSPVVTFVDGEVNDDHFKIFKIADYVAVARDIYKLLNQPRLAGVAPVRLRPAQLLDHVTSATVAASYHALLIRYESSGASLFAPQPRILVYPALIVQRDGGTLFTVIDREEPIVMNLRADGDEEVESIAPHLVNIADQAKMLLQTCSDEIGVALTPSTLDDFPGFPEVQDEVDPKSTALPLGSQRKRVVRPLQRVGDEWLLVTGQLSHYLLAEPTVACRFHAWGECRAVGQQIGQSAISIPRAEPPRSFFVDAQSYHCAHRVVQDRRERRCYIAAMDMRTCCRACAYQGLCWTEAEIIHLPCGG